MTAEDIKWQLEPICHPLGEEFIPSRARPHAYLKNAKTLDKSLCGKHSYFEDLEDVNAGVRPDDRYYIKPCKELFCNKCLKELEKLGVTF